MENKTAAILVLAILGAVVATAGATYALTARQAPYSGSSYSGTTNGYGMGPGMMGGYSGYGWMMGGHGTMGSGYGYGPGSMWQYMQQYMARYWNSTSAP